MQLLFYLDFFIIIIIIIIIIINIIFWIGSVLPAHRSTVSQTADAPAGVEVLSCERRTSACSRAPPPPVLWGFIVPAFSLFVVSESVTQRNPSPVLGNLMLQTLPRGTFEDCYIRTHFPQKRSFPLPSSSCLPPFYCVFFSPLRQ